MERNNIRGNYKINDVFWLSPFLLKRQGTVDYTVYDVGLFLYFHAG